MSRAWLAFSALSPHRQGLLAVTAAAVFWSTGGVLIKAVSLDAAGVAMWRAPFAALTIALLVRPRVRGVLRMGWLRWSLALTYAATLLLFVIATKLTTAANAIFLQFTAPLYLFVLSPLVLKERPTRADAFAVAAAFGGMALFFIGRLEADEVAGNLCAAGSGVAFAAFLLMLRLPACTPRLRPQGMVLGNLILAGGLLAYTIARRDADSLTPGTADFVGLLVLGVFQIGVPYAIFSFGIARVRALEASLVGMLEPVLNPVWVFIVLREAPGWWSVLGGTIIVAAVAGRMVRAERRPPSIPARALDRTGT